MISLEMVDLYSDLPCIHPPPHLSLLLIIIRYYVLDVISIFGGILHKYVYTYRDTHVRDT